MSHELASSLRQEIIAKHNQGVSLDKQLRETLLSKLETTRQCGLLLSEAADNFRNGQWEEFASKLPFDGQAIRAYLSFARKHKEPVTDIRAGLHYAVEAAMASGLIEFPHGHGQEQLHEPNFLSKLSLTIQQLASEWRKFVSRRPLNQMSPESLELILHSLRPIDRIRSEILRSLKHGKS